ncbi:hypothetical protein BT96DRAFT_944266 [Gymnopus androsaceus JB14]|uniref:Uncharacterized protein n=1 Tax=Gymnopus androsaceus JB14 TaxID=1447944 RepID=A0A6A4H430_9AGAR|nr:hypothetical protein BT96DRAFT_944266 [Gymnopus androsaceus JB14]
MGMYSPQPFRRQEMTAEFRAVSIAYGVAMEGTTANWGSLKSLPSSSSVSIVMPGCPVRICVNCGSGGAKRACCTLSGNVDEAWEVGTQCAGCWHERKLGTDRQSIVGVKEDTGSGPVMHRMARGTWSVAGVRVMGYRSREVPLPVIDHWERAEPGKGEARGATCPPAGPRRREPAQPETMESADPGVELRVIETRATWEVVEILDCPVAGTAMEPPTWNEVRRERNEEWSTHGNHGLWMSWKVQALETRRIGLESAKADCSQRCDPLAEQLVLREQRELTDRRSLPAETANLSLDPLHRCARIQLGSRSRPLESGSGKEVGPWTRKPWEVYGVTQWSLRWAEVPEAHDEVRWPWPYPFLCLPVWSPVQQRPQHVYQQWVRKLQTEHLHQGN